jgi:hypothetical protein
MPSYSLSLGERAGVRACSKTGLNNARRAGRFSERKIKGLGGKHCRYPIPIMHSDERLDPSSRRFFAAPDPICRGMWGYLADS